MRHVVIQLTCSTISPNKRKRDRRRKALTDAAGLVAASEELKTSEAFKRAGE